MESWRVPQVPPVRGGWKAQILSCTAESESGANMGLGGYRVSQSVQSHTSCMHGRNSPCWVTSCPIAVP